MKSLVTGATSYIGSKLCERLLAQGWEVDAIVRTSGRPLRSAGERLPGTAVDS